MLFDKLRTVPLVSEDAPTGSAATSADIDVANVPYVQLHVGYTADGSGKTLRLYPEVRVVIPGVAELWLPAASAVPDVAGATIDADGYLPLPVASPIYEVAGIDGADIKVAIDLPIRAGDRFRVRYLEDGYDSGHPAELIILATPSRGAS